MGELQTLRLSTRLQSRSPPSRGVGLRRRRIPGYSSSATGAESTGFPSFAVPYSPRDFPNSTRFPDPGKGGSGTSPKRHGKGRPLRVAANIRSSGARKTGNRKSPFRADRDTSAVRRARSLGRFKCAAPILFGGIATALRGERTRFRRTLVRGSGTARIRSSGRGRAPAILPARRNTVGRFVDRRTGTAHIVEAFRLLVTFAAYGTLGVVGLSMARKFLFVSHDGLGLDLAWTIRREGHAVKFCILDRREKNVGDGFVDKVDEWEPSVEWADVVVFDDSGFGPDVERLKRGGKAVVGGGCYTDRLEMDREFAQKELKGSGMSILPSWDFGSFEDAIRFLRENPMRCVIKPNGRAQDEKVLSYVGQEEDGGDVISMLERYKKGWGRKLRSFQVQKYAAGIEVAVGAFFNGKEFVLPAFINFEHKRLFNDNIGPSTGEMGTSSFWADPNRLYRETLAPMVPRLAAAGYVGYFDVNCIATSRTLYPLECTPRFGYPTINLQIEGVVSPWGEFLAALAEGRTYSLRTKRGFQVGVVVAVPPFPFEDLAAFRRYSEDAPVIFRRPGIEGVHPCDVRIEEDQWLLAGSSGYALVVTGSGSTMEDARREAYGRVRNILIPNMFYRTDIGERWTRDSDLLQAWGYLS